MKYDNNFVESPIPRTKTPEAKVSEHKIALNFLKFKEREILKFKYTQSTAVSNFYIFPVLTPYYPT